MSACARTPLLVAAFLVLTGIAWLMSTPPGQSFDEGAHYVKAIAAGRGELYGSKPEVSLANLRDLYRLGAGDPDKFGQLDSALESRAVQWQNRTRRRFEVPPNLIDSRIGCGRSADRDRCLRRGERGVGGEGAGHRGHFRRLMRSAGLTTSVRRTPKRSLTTTTSPCAISVPLT